MTRLYKTNLPAVLITNMMATVINKKITDTAVTNKISFITGTQYKNSVVHLKLLACTVYPHKGKPLVQQSFIWQKQDRRGDCHHLHLCQSLYLQDDAGCSFSVDSRQI